VSAPESLSSSMQYGYTFSQDDANVIPE